MLEGARVVEQGALFALECFVIISFIWLWITAERLMTESAILIFSTRVPLQRFPPGFARDIKGSTASDMLSDGH